MPITGRGDFATALIDGRGRLIIGPISERGDIVVSNAVVVYPPVIDAFNRADRVSGLGNADTGQLWQIVRGNFGIYSNEAFAYSVDSMAVIECLASDGEVSVTPTFVVFNDTASLVFRYTDSANYWAIGIDASSYIKLIKVVNGTWNTILNQPSGFITGDLVKVVLSGPDISIYINNDSWTSYTDSFNQLGTKYGLMSLYQSTTIDNFSMIPAGNEEPEDPGTPGSISYATKQVISRVSSTAYATKQVISQVSSVSYATRQTISRTAATAYATRQTISQTAAIPYATKQVISRTGSTAYATQQNITSGGVPGSIAYATKQVISQAGAAAYATKQVISRTASTAYATQQVITSGGVPGSVAYATKQVISAAGSIAYATRQTISRAASTAYATRQAIFAAGAISYATKQIVSRVAATDFATKQSIFQVAGSVSHAVRVRIFRTGSTSYATKQAIYSVDTSIIRKVRLRGRLDTSVRLKGLLDSNVRLKGSARVTADKQNFEMYAGDTKRIEIPVEDAVDISGVTVVWMLKKTAYDADPLVTKTTPSGITLDIVKKEVHVLLQPTDTEELVGDHFHAARLTDVAGNVSTITAGTITFKRL